MNALPPDPDGTTSGDQPVKTGLARIDRDGRLIEADARLMQLHRALGGSVDGELAVPQLLDLARHCQRLAMRLSRPVTAASTDSLIDLWCECSPDIDGVTLTLTHWRERPLPSATEMSTPGRGPTLPADPQSARITLDAQGRIIRFAPPQGFGREDGHDPVLLQPLASLVDSEGKDLAAIHGQRVTLMGDEREWIASIHPEADLPGVTIILHPAPPPAAPDAPAPMPPLFDGQRLAHLFGSKIGPALRQPIGRIIANAETIGGRLEGPLRADYADYACDIAAAGRHLLALVDDLADLEAIDATGFRAIKEPVDLADLARRAAQLLALKAADRQIRIDRPAEDETLPATGEFRRVLQVLLNLLGNAITYAPDGSMIWLRLDDGPGWASVTIADQGPGLSDDEQQRLFNKWERLGRSGDGGSGLGLYISRRLALAMGGELTVESAPGQGARFTLVLPAT